MIKSLRQLAQDLHIDASELEAFAAEDNVGGWPNEWGMGSMPASDGKILYALVRALRPDVVVEFGTFYGCSSAHILAALVVNRRGILHSYDLYDRIEYDKISSECQDIWDIHIGDAHVAELPLQADVVFEDTDHGIDNTRKLIERGLTLQPRIILSHDGAHYLAGGEVRTGFNQAINAIGTVIQPKGSCCGFIYHVP